MEAAATLSGEKAQRIVDAMRVSVAARGAAGSTFDHVAREAGVSRGLLHYYFGTKERLLVEVVRRDCDLRLAGLDEALAGAHTAEDLLDVLVRSLEDLVEREPGLRRPALRAVHLGAPQPRDRGGARRPAPAHARARRRAPAGQARPRA